MMMRLETSRVFVAMSPSLAKKRSSFHPARIRMGATMGCSTTPIVFLIAPVARRALLEPVAGEPLVLHAPPHGDPVNIGEVV